MTDHPAPASNEITVFVNGTEKRLSAGVTAHDLLIVVGLAGRPVAVEVNEVVVPRADLGEQILKDQDRLEIVTLVGGG